MTMKGTWPLLTHTKNCTLIEVTEEEVENVVKHVPKLDTLVSPCVVVYWLCSHHVSVAVFIMLHSHSFHQASFPVFIVFQSPSFRHAPVPQFSSCSSSPVFIMLQTPVFIMLQSQFSSCSNPSFHHAPIPQFSSCSSPSCHLMIPCETCQKKKRKKKGGGGG